MAQYDLEIFQRDLEALGIALSGEQTGQFLRYYELLLEWNGRMNLTAITEYQEVLKKHFVDSLSLVKVCRPAQGDTLIDVGTGAGFPGLALKIAFPGLKVTLLDSLNKRIQFLNAVIEELKLIDVEAVHGRAEDYAAPGRGRETFDFCVSRAVAHLSTLSEYCLPFVKKGGQFIAYKSEKGPGEVADAQKAISVLGGRVRESVEFALPDSDIHRNLVVVEKVQKTPAKYPRKAGLPSREPYPGDREKAREAGGVMKKEDYQVLRELLKEFREEDAGLKARIEEHDGRVKEAELRLKTIQDSEPEDRKVFSPRRVEVLYKEEIGRIKEEKAVHEEQIQRLCSQREVLEKRISRLEAVCRHQREHARRRRDSSLMDLENIIGRIENSSGYIDRNPIQARQELAIIAKSLRELVDRMREGEKP